MPNPKNPKHKPHRTPFWKRDTLLLTSLLRLRVHPTPPYPLIAHTILTHFHDPVIRFYTRYACPSTSDPNYTEEALLFWLANWLEEKYAHAEKWLEECFLQAVAKEDAVVKQVLEVCGLEEFGYGVKGEGEWKGEVGWLVEGKGEGSFGVVEEGELATASSSLIDDGKGEESEEGKRRECVNAELLESLRNLEVEDGQLTVVKPQSLQTQIAFPPASTLAPAPQQAPAAWGSTLNPQTAIFQPLQRKPESYPTLDDLATATVFYDKYTGQILDFNPSENPQMMQEYVAQPGVFTDPKKASLAARLQNGWNGFSEQLDEIKALEEMLSMKQAARMGVMAGGCADWADMYSSGY